MIPPSVYGSRNTPPWGFCWQNWVLYLDTVDLSYESMSYSVVGNVRKVSVSRV